MTKRLNRAKCSNCGDVIVSRHRHDFVTCSCESISVDGGQEYNRYVGDFDKILVFRNRKWVPLEIKFEKPEQCSKLKPLIFMHEFKQMCITAFECTLVPYKMLWEVIQEMGQHIYNWLKRG